MVPKCERAQLFWSFGRREVLVLAHQINRALVVKSRIAIAILKMGNGRMHVNMGTPGRISIRHRRVCRHVRTRGSRRSDCWSFHISSLSIEHALGVSPSLCDLFTLLPFVRLGSPFFYVAAVYRASVFLLVGRSF